MGKLKSFFAGLSRKSGDKKSNTEINTGESEIAAECGVIADESVQDDESEDCEYKREPGFRGFIKAYIPVGAIVLYAVFAVSLVCYIVSIISTPFADFFNDHIAAYVRMATAKITGVVPFSLAETVVILLPFIFFCIIYSVIHISNKSGSRASTRFFVGAFAVCSLFFSLFVFTYGTGYRTSTIDVKLGLQRNEVSAEELEKTARYLSEKLAEASDHVQFASESSSVMPYNLTELSKKLSDAYSKTAEQYDFILDYDSRLKYVTLSEGMSYIHVLGMYTYYTGEANLNMAWLDYSIPFSGAHEMAHQRGISREEEANFVAYIVCMNSDDWYIRYSGYLNVFEYVTNALYKADKSAYQSVMDDTDIRVRYELNAYYDFFQKYRGSEVSKVNDTLNDINLKVNGQKEGSNSYNLVTDLAVAYILYGDGAEK